MTLDVLDSASIPASRHGEFLGRVIEEFNLNTQDPFTRLLAACFAFQDERDTLRNQVALVVEQNTTLRARIAELTERSRLDPLSHAWKSGYAQAIEEQKPPIAELEAALTRNINMVEVVQNGERKFVDTAAPVAAEVEAMAKNLENNYLTKEESYIYASMLRSLSRQVAELTALQERNEGRVKEIVSEQLLQRAERAEAAHAALLVTNLALQDERDAAIKDARRLDFLLAVTTADGAAEDDPRAIAMALAFAKGLDGRSAIDAAIAQFSGPDPSLGG